MAIEKPCSGDCDEDTLIIVNELKSIVQAVDDALFPTLDKHINFQSGSSLQIITELLKAGGNAATKDKKYPLIGVFQPFREEWGYGGYLVRVRIPKIIIACLTTNTDKVSDRYDKNFTPILDPIWKELKNQLAASPLIVGNDPETFNGNKMDVPGSPPPEEKGKVVFNDFLDAIHIYDLELIFESNC